MTCHVRDIRWCNRVGLNLEIRQTLAGTQRLIRYFNVSKNFHFLGLTLFLHVLACCKTSPHHQVMYGAQERLLMNFQRVALAAEVDCLEHRVHVTSPSIFSSRSRGLCIYLGFLAWTPALGTFDPSSFQVQDASIYPASWSLPSVRHRGRDNSRGGNRSCRTGAGGGRTAGWFCNLDPSENDE